MTNYISYILITKDKYNDKLKYVNNYIELIWEGQKNKYIHDYTIKSGTHVFYRYKTGIFYTYLGKVSYFKILSHRTSTHPIKYKLIINNPKKILCNNINNNNSYKYQNACWRTLNLHPFTANGHGIYKICIN